MQSKCQVYTVFSTMLNSNTIRAPLVQLFTIKMPSESVNIYMLICVGYVCFYSIPCRTKKFFHKHQSVDNVSETSVTDESMSESTATSVPRVRQ